MVHGRRSTGCAASCCRWSTSTRSACRRPGRGGARRGEHRRAAGRRAPVRPRRRRRSTTPRRSSSSRWASSSRASALRRRHDHGRRRVALILDVMGLAQRARARQPKSASWRKRRSRGGQNAPIALLPRGQRARMAAPARGWCPARGIRRRPRSRAPARTAWCSTAAAPAAHLAHRAAGRAGRGRDAGSFGTRLPPLQAVVVKVSDRERTASSSTEHRRHRRGGTHCAAARRRAGA
jgi:hypothetical protein